MAEGSINGKFNRLMLEEGSSVINAVEDISKARLLLQSALETNPKHPRPWIAAARLEEVAGNIGMARDFIRRGYEECPNDKDVWIEVCRLMPNPHANIGMIAAAMLKEEEETNAPNGAKDSPMVARLVQMCKNVLTQGQEGVEMDREFWIKEAEAAEQAGHLSTCSAIIANTIGIGALMKEQDDRAKTTTWLADARECKQRGSIETARAIYAHALTVFSTNKSVWVQALHFEKNHGTRESADALLRQAAVTLRRGM